MDLRPGALLGLPEGVPSVVYDAAAWRNLLVALALASGWMMARWRPGPALALAVAWAVLAIGFWTAALGRPYGVLVDPATTRWAAEVSVAASAAGEDGFLAAEPAVWRRWTAAAPRIGASLLLAPTLTPLAVYPAIALLIAFVWGRSQSCLAAILWLAVSTLDQDVVRGTAFLAALWPAPSAGIAVVGVLGVALASGRWFPRAGAALGAAPAIAASIVVGAGHPLAPADLGGALVFDALPWVALGLFGLWSQRDPAALGLAAGGAAAVALAVIGLADGVVACALYRAGLVLAAAPVIADAAERASGVVSLSLPRGRVWSPDGAAARGVIVAVTMAGSFVTWWDPPRTDAVVRDSLDPLPDGLVEAMGWIRANTDPRGAFVAGEDYAEAVAVLGGRRVLRAPTLLTPADDQRRLRLQRAILSRRPVDTFEERYRLRYVLLAHGQFRDHRLEEPWAIDSAGLPPLYHRPSGLRVYELPPSRDPIMPRP